MNDLSTIFGNNLLGYADDSKLFVEIPNLNNLLVGILPILVTGANFKQC